MHSRVAALLLTTLIACRTESRASPPPAGSQLTLTLVVSSPRHIMPELEARIAPVSDTGVAVLTVQRVDGDSAFGTYRGPAPGFWPVFRDLGSRFSLTSVNGQWELALGPEVADAGMDLRGTLDGPIVRGSWVSRGPTPDSGTFTLAGQLTNR